MLLRIADATIAAAAKSRRDSTLVPLGTAPDGVPGITPPTPTVLSRARESAPPITPVTAASTRYTTKYDARSFDQTSKVPERMSPARLPRIGGPMRTADSRPGTPAGRASGRPAAPDIPAGTPEDMRADTRAEGQRCPSKSGESRSSGRRCWTARSRTRTWGRTSARTRHSPLPRASGHGVVEPFGGIPRAPGYVA